MGRTSALLALALFAALFAYDKLSSHLWSASLWWDVAWIACVLMPATFALVLLALPLRRWAYLLPAGLGFAVLAAVFTAADAQVLANFSRLAAATLLGWWFLRYFEELSWVVLVACVIPWVDAYSVWRGPTKQIVSHHEHVFTVLSYAFPVPGEHSAANLGVPDLLFFALFLGAAAQFELRVVLDLDRARRRARGDDRADGLVRALRPARAAGDRARLPAAQRRPALAPATTATRAR